MAYTKEENREYMRQWRAANPENVREAGRKSYYKHREARLENNREWRAANPEKVREYARRHFAKINSDVSTLAEALYYAVQGSLTRKTRKLDFNLTIPYIQSLLEKQNYYDAYYPHLKLGLRGRGKDPFSASVDRKDPSKGYVKGNVHIVCLSTNQQKGELTHKQMLNLVAKITGAA